MFGRNNNITEIQKIDDTEYVVYFVCPFCGKEHFESITAEEFERLKNPENLMGTIFKDRDATFREKFITGMCETCQKDTFGNEDEK